jgi:hypothetical protein
MGARLPTAPPWRPSSTMRCRTYPLPPVVQGGQGGVLKRSGLIGLVVHPDCVARGEEAVVPGKDAGPPHPTPLPKGARANSLHLDRGSQELAVALVLASTRRGRRPSPGQRARPLKTSFSSAQAGGVKAATPALDLTRAAPLPAAKAKPRGSNAGAPGLAGFRFHSTPAAPLFFLSSSGINSSSLPRALTE